VTRHEVRSINTHTAKHSQAVWHPEFFQRIPSVYPVWSICGRIFITCCSSVIASWLLSNDAL